MARFSDLSNEVILLISKHVRPPDLDSFHLTSKHIRNLNEAHISNHLTLKRRYQNIRRDPTIWGSPEPKDTTWAKILKETLTSPSVASYVEEVDIQGYHKSWLNPAMHDTRENERRAETLLESNVILFEEAAQSSKYLSDKVNWMDYVVNGYEDGLLGLLLTLLPNLSCLALSVTCSGRDGITDVVESVSQDLTPLSFTMLTRVTLSGESSEVPLHLIGAFAIMPSMRHLYAENINCTARVRTPTTRRSKVTHLCLLRCYVEPEPLFELLCLFDSLIEFEYTHGERKRRSHDLNIDYTPFWITSALKQNSAQSLKALTLRGHVSGVMSAFIGCLQPLTMLEELDTDLEALMGEGEDEYCPKMSESLPVSLTKLRLHHLIGDYDLEGLLHVILNPKLKQLPRLRSLEFTPENTEPLELPLRWKSACKKAGISLTTT